MSFQIFLIYTDTLEMIDNQNAVESTVAPIISLSTTFTVSSLTPDFSYGFYVKIVDPDNNIIKSGTVSQSTLGVNEPSAPVYQSLFYVILLLSILLICALIMVV